MYTKSHIRQPSTPGQPYAISATFHRVIQHIRTCICYTLPAYSTHSEQRNILWLRPLAHSIIFLHVLYKISNRLWCIVEYIYYCFKMQIYNLNTETVRPAYYSQWRRRVLIVDIIHIPRRLDITKPLPRTGQWSPVQNQLLM